jgi:hypothetical protein
MESSTLTDGSEYGQGKAHAVTQFDPRKNKQMPAPRAGGLYKTFYQQGGVVLVEADPSRAFRDGSGTFQIASLPEIKPNTCAKSAENNSKRDPVTDSKHFCGSVPEYAVLTLAMTPALNATCSGFLKTHHKSS